MIKISIGPKDIQIIEPWKTSPVKHKMQLATSRFCYISRSKLEPILAQLKIKNIEFEVNGLHGPKAVGGGNAGTYRQGGRVIRSTNSLS